MSKINEIENITKQLELANYTFLLLLERRELVNKKCKT